MQFETAEQLEELSKEIDTLGDLQIVLKVLKENGWTKDSVGYVVGQVWWED